MNLIYCFNNCKKKNLIFLNICCITGELTKAVVNNVDFSYIVQDNCNFIFTKKFIHIKDNNSLSMILVKWLSSLFIVLLKIYWLHIWYFTLFNKVLTIEITKGKNSYRITNTSSHVLTSFIIISKIILITFFFNIFMDHQ